RGALAMDVQDKAADRHRRIAAIVDELVPSLVAEFGHIHPERRQQVQRMARRHAAFGKRATQADRFLLAVALAKQLSFEQVEIGKLVGRAKCCVIGDVVGGPDKVVERKNHSPVPRMDQKGGNREILVAVSLAGSQFARSSHRELATLSLSTGLKVQNSAP